MPLASNHFEFLLGSPLRDVEDDFDDSLVASTLIVGELRLRAPFGGYPYLEEARMRVLNAITTSDVISIRGRGVLLATATTDLRAVFATLAAVATRQGKSYNTLPLTLNTHRRFLDVDIDLLILKGHWSRALAELKTMHLPQAWLDLVQNHLNQDSAQHRVSAVCSMIYLGALLLAQAEGTL